MLENKLKVIYSNHYWRREWQTTSAFLPREPHEQYEKTKDMTLKDELPRLVGVQYNTGKEQRNNSRRNEEVEPKQKQCPVWMCLVVKIKSDIVVLEKPVESPLDSKEIQPVNPKGNQS